MAAGVGSPLGGLSLADSVSRPALVNTDVSVARRLWKRWRRILMWTIVKFCPSHRSE